MNHRDVNRSRRGRPRRAVILIFVLLLLSVCGSICGQFVSKVLRLNVKAVASEKEIQQRWAIISLRRSVLEDANTLMSLSNAGAVNASSDQATVLRLSIRLSDSDYSLQLEDESAKLPLQRLLVENRHESLRPVLRELAPRAGNLKSVLPRNASSWKQIFSTPSLGSPRLSLAWLQNAVPELTLHSDGRINIRGCRDAALNALWRYKFGAEAPRELHEVRRNPILQDLRSISNASNLSPTEFEFLQSWCSISSNTFSLWLDGTNEDGYGFTAIYFRRSVPGFADEQFGFHSP